MDQATSAAQTHRASVSCTPLGGEQERDMPSLESCTTCLSYTGHVNTTSPYALTKGFLTTKPHSGAAGWGAAVNTPFPRFPNSSFYLLHPTPRLSPSLPFHLSRAQLQHSNTFHPVSSPKALPSCTQRSLRPRDAASAGGIMKDQLTCSNCSSTEYKKPCLTTPGSKESLPCSYERDRRASIAHS